MTVTALEPLPKAELHLHIEGTFEPDLIFAIARRNGVALPYDGVDALAAAYQFRDLQSFLDLYYAAMNVLREPRDFTELADAYLARAQAQGVRHAEIFFDPQAHTSRGVAFTTVIDGLWASLASSEERFGITTGLIMCFLRDRSEDEAFDALREALPYRDRIIGVGLDSAERGNPPGKFARVYAEARAHGFRAVAHAGEEGPPSYITEALDLLGCERIDHGVRAIEDAEVTARLAAERIPLTVCPFSNVKLRVVDTLADHPLRLMIEAGLMVTINSDDPAYFGGYVDDNYAGVATALGLDDAALAEIARASFRASFLDEERKARYIVEVDEASSRRARARNAPTTAPATVSPTIP